MMQENVNISNRHLKDIIVSTMNVIARCMASSKEFDFSVRSTVQY